ncbi:MAG TPA: DUF1800 domain-containing protein [Patescibacteria group bacterium]|nr:DUF1800 domain-containing protein [Patescibacteria group bacterium]
MSIEAFIATTRFGLGAKKGELSAVSADPQGWLHAQLNPRYAKTSAYDGLPTTAQALAQLKEYRLDRKAMKKAQAGGDEATAAAVKSMLKEQGKDYIHDIARRTRVLAASDAPFFERLVQFWSNHFTVSSSKRFQMGLVADFEREAIRPNIMGDFLTLLRASTRHPAMLMYLDNQRSVGPNSMGGKFGGKGLNENLAREIMELHTLGVGGGYTQGDVTEFARILTGWSVDVDGRGDGNGFFFRPMIHEQGEKTLLGEIYPQDGVNEGEKALATFAAHPSTARFIATKLARHFIADDPPAGAVRQLEAAFTRSNGKLIPVYKTLLSLPETWAEPLAKVKTPNDYVVSMLRATGVDDVVDDIKLVGAYKMLGQVPFSAPSPAGWSDRAKDWVGAEALLQRIELARKIARGVHTKFAPVDLLEATIGPVASAETKFAVARAGSKEEAITLLFASPEFQRR